MCSLIRACGMQYSIGEINTTAVALRQFELFLKSAGIKYLDDTPFRRAAFDLALESSLRSRRPLSMVDCLIRLLLEDVNTRINYLATFNRQDFIDVCNRYRVEFILRPV